MPEGTTPLDRLQPCLLDRLTDEEPGKREESRNQRIISVQRYKAGVLRDLEWLFNSIGHFPDERVGDVTFADFEAAYRSVINFGIRQLYGRLAPDIDEIERQLTDAIIVFEPRINRRTLRVNVSIKRNILSIELTGELWVNPLPEELFIKTELDLESCQCSVRERLAMDERLLAYYNSELRHVREMGAEFAREFPKIAGRLALDRDAKEICPDPYVERLLEGFAFLAARVHLKLDAEFPRFTQTLLETVYPHYLCPVPSMGVVHFEPDPREPGPEEGFMLERGTALRSQGDETPCQFRTAHDIRLWPLKIDDARYYTRTIIELGLPGSLEAKAALLVRLQTTGDKKFKELKLDRLPFFIRGGDEIPIWVYEQIFARGTHVVLQPPKGQGQFREILPGSTIQRLGFQEAEALLPRSPRSFEGYRLLKEYFACPQRFLFFELTGLASAVQQCDGNKLEIIIALRTAEPKLDNRIDANCFALFCTPVINLFPKRLDPILISDRFAEFHIVAERTRPIDYEVFQIQQVVGILAKVNEEQRFEPFFLARDSEARPGAYYTINRAPRVLTAKEKKFGAVSSYAGSEVFISLVDAKVAPYRRQLSQLNITALCTNRHLPIQLPISVGDTDLGTELYSPVASIRWVAVPTVPVASTAEGDPSWRIISHLSLNYLSLLDAKEGDGAVALRDLLKLYVNPNDVFASRQIEGIRSVVATPIVRRVTSAGPLTFARGLEIRVIIDEEAFEGSGIFILGAVLAQFFARYISINSFTETVIVSQRRGEIMRWPSLIGRRQIA